MLSTTCCLFMTTQGMTSHSDCGFLTLDIRTALGREDADAWSLTRWLGLGTRRRGLVNDREEVWCSFIFPCLSISHYTTSILTLVIGIAIYLAGLSTQDSSVRSLKRRKSHGFLSATITQTISMVSTKVWPWLTVENRALEARIRDDFSRGLEFT